MRFIFVVALFACASTLNAQPITVRESPTDITIETDALEAKIKKTGYVSGVSTSNGARPP